MQLATKTCCGVLLLLGAILSNSHAKASDCQEALLRKASETFELRTAGPQLFQQINKGSTAVLEKLPESVQKAARLTGYATGIGPLFKALANEDKFFFLLIEGPLMGLVTTPASVEIANLLHGNSLAINQAFIQNAAGSYGSYQVANLPRTGVAIQDDLSPRAKVFLNWWYSTAIYAIGTTWGQVSTATTLDQQAYVAGLVVFAGLWPVFSQYVNVNVVTPLLFSGFPKASLLKKIHDPMVSTDSILLEQQKRIDDLEKALSDLNGVTKDKALREKTKKLSKSLDSARAEMRWIWWFRSGVASGSPLPSSRGAHYWLKKTPYSMAAAMSMVTIYFILRWTMVGEQAGDDKLITRILKLFLADAQKNEGVTSDGPSDEELGEFVPLIRQAIENFKTLHSEPIPGPMRAG